MKRQLGFLMLLTALQLCACSNRSPTQTPEAQTAGQSDVKPDNNDLLQALQGKWQSVSDSTYVLEITDGKMRHLNNGQLSVASDIGVDGACDNVSCQGADAADGWCFLEKGQFDIQCHLVLKCSPTELKYAALGAADGQLSFKKVR